MNRERNYIEGFVSRAENILYINIGMFQMEKKSAYYNLLSVEMRKILSATLF